MSMGVVMFGVGPLISATVFVGVVVLGFFMVGKCLSGVRSC